jgi:hypothetical protein
MKVRTGSAINGKACILIHRNSNFDYNNEYKLIALLQKVYNTTGSRKQFGSCQGLPPPTLPILPGSGSVSHDAEFYVVSGLILTGMLFAAARMPMLKYLNWLVRRSQPCLLSKRASA